MSNVVVTGGTSLTQGFNDRLQAELTALAGGMKMKIRKFQDFCFPRRDLGEVLIFTFCWLLCVDAASSPAERVYSSWLGGSILASLGTFHQVRSLLLHPIWKLSSLKSS